MMLPPLPFPRRFLPWILLVVSIVAVTWAVLMGERTMVGLGVVGVVLALLAIAGSRVAEGEEDEVGAEETEANYHR